MKHKTNDLVSKNSASITHPARASEGRTTVSQAAADIDRGPKRSFPSDVGCSITREKHAKRDQTLSSRNAGALRALKCFNQNFVIPRTRSRR